MKRGCWIAVFTAALSACASLVPSPRVAAPPTPEAAAAAWGRVLERFVDDEGRVDFAALRADRADLDRYVAFIAALPPEALPAGPDRLAHYINSYNALSMYNVLESGIPRTHAGLRKIRFFVLREHVIGGRRWSLYAFENEVIRPLGEPRVHFVLNCSAVSCPRLPRRPFRGDELETQFERETRRFFAEARNFRVDQEGRTVWLSEIQRFYAEDFVPGHAPSLIAYANRYAPEPAPLDYRVRFTPYDWTIANRPTAR